MKLLASSRVYALIVLTLFGFVLIASNADARKHRPKPSPTPHSTATPTPTPRPTPPPAISAAGDWTRCGTVTDSHQFGSNSIQTLSVTKTFTGTLNGSFIGTEYDFVKSDGSGVFYGDGLFTGNVNGKNGTFWMNYVGRIGSDDSYDAHWVIHDGTGELTQLF